MFTKEALQLTIIDPLLENLAHYKEIFVDQLGVALGIIIITWIGAKIVQVIIKLLLRVLQFDKLSDKIGITKFLEHSGLFNIPSTTVSNLFYWIILFIGFTVAVNVFNAPAFILVQRLILYIPQALVAVFIFIIGMAFALFLSKLLQSAIIRAGMRERVAVFLKNLLFASIAIFSLLLGIGQLKVESEVIQVIINNVLQYSFLGLAIAFGLGGRVIAADIIASFKLRGLYKKGSEINYDNITGVLKDIGWFDSLVYTEEGVINIPNSALARKSIKRKI